MLKRSFDIIIAALALVVLSFLFIVIAIAVKISGKGNVFYTQCRVGRDNKDFSIYKFRTMYSDSDKKGLLTIGGRDARITPVGYFLRKYKLDELPQLLNVIMGDMSLVGPRPEVRRYVALYNREQQRVLEVAPGITDYASIMYSNENEILGNSAEPEQEYINRIMPAKLALNLKYIDERSFTGDVKILVKTIVRIWT